MFRACLVCCSALLCACHSGEPPASPPLRYGALPRAPSTPRFVPDAQLSPLTLACRPAELPEENGIDDDCDGRIDHASLQRSDLTLVAAHTGQDVLELELTADGDPARAASARRAASRSQSQTVHVNRLELRALEPGRYTVSLRRSEGGAGALPASLAVESVQGVQLYLTSLTPGAVVAVGRVEVP